MADNQKFYQDISQLLDNARKQAKTAVNTAMVYTYYEIGRRIVEEEQHGENRAAYGQQILQGLSDHLTKAFGKGYSVGNLKISVSSIWFSPMTKLAKQCLANSPISQQLAQAESFFSAGHTI